MQQEKFYYKLDQHSAQLILNSCATKPSTFRLVVYLLLFLRKTTATIAPINNNAAAKE